MPAKNFVKMAVYVTARDKKLLEKAGKAAGVSASVMVRRMIAYGIDMDCDLLVWPGGPMLDLEHEGYHAKGE